MLWRDESYFIFDELEFEGVKTVRYAVVSKGLAPTQLEAEINKAVDYDCLLEAM